MPCHVESATCLQELGGQRRDGAESGHMKIPSYVLVNLKLLSGALAHLDAFSKKQSLRCALEACWWLSHAKSRARRLAWRPYNFYA